MEPRDEKLVQELAPSNDELRRAYENHTRLKEEVDELASRAHLTAEEELHRKELQKLKLAEKDKIARMLDEHRRAATSA